MFQTDDKISTPHPLGAAFELYRPTLRRCRLNTSIFKLTLGSYELSKNSKKISIDFHSGFDSIFCNYSVSRFFTVFYVVFITFEITFFLCSAWNSIWIVRKLFKSIDLSHYDLIVFVWECSLWVINVSKRYGLYKLHKWEIVNFNWIQDHKTLNLFTGYWGSMCRTLAVLKMQKYHFQY